jgi:hypothetical protein
MIPRRFKLVYAERTVAYGVLWSDNSASVKWGPYGEGRERHQSFVTWPNMEYALEHSFTPEFDTTKPKLEWIDEEVK